MCYPYYDPDVEAAWSIGYTGKGVTVAVVDNGIDYTNTDLKLNLASLFSSVNLKL